MHAHDYDPVKNAVVGFRQLLWLFHHWLLTVYHAIPPASGLKMSINDRWQEGLRLVQPTFFDRNADLDFQFGIVRPGTRTLDHRGVVYEGLYYYCEAADVLRYRDGASLQVRLKVNPPDLLRAHVWDELERFWIPLKARDERYATGLDLHTHQLLRRQARERSGRGDVQGWLEALFRIRFPTH